MLKSKQVWMMMGLLAIATLTLAACGSNPAVMYRGGAQRTGLYDAPGVPELGGVKWKFETGDGIWPSPVVTDGVVYVGSDDDHLYAVDVETGEEVWKFYTLKNMKPADTRRPLYDDFSSSPLVVDGVVYVGGVDGSACFYAIDAQTGPICGTRLSFATAAPTRSMSPAFRAPAPWP
jgi:hypothetical protein